MSKSFFYSFKVGMGRNYTLFAEIDGVVQVARDFDHPKRQVVVSIDASNIVPRRTIPHASIVKER